MEPRVKFFQKLRHLAGHLEKETENLKEIAETKNSDDTSEEGCLSTLHKLKSDVRDVKMKMQQGMAKCREEMVQDLSFIEAWTKKREELRDALDTMRIRYEQYGYMPREPAPKPPECEKVGSEARAEDEEEEEPEKEAGEEEEGDEEAEEDDDGPSEPKKNKPQDECTPDRIAIPSVFQEMSTPKLEDVGLSELHFQNMMKKCAMAGVGQTPMPPSLPRPPVQNRHKLQEECTPDHIAIPSDFQEMCTPKLEDVGLSERDLQNMLRNCGVAGGEAPLPQPPRIVLSPAATLPPVPKTPKCYLRLDEDMPTPRIEDFGISEYTLRLNNDFTMDLLRGQKPAKTAGKPHASEVPRLATEGTVACTPVRSLYSSESPQRPSDDLTSPEVPTFQTPYLSRLMSVHKEAKSKDLTSIQMTGLSDCDDGAHLESPHREADDMNSPEVPTFQTPYLSKLMSVHKEAKSKTKDMSGPMAVLSGCASVTSPHHNASHHYDAVTRDEDVPDMESRLTCEDDLQRTPEMPVLQSSLGISLQTQYSTFEARSLSVISRPGEAAAGAPGPCAAADPHESQTQEWSLASPRVRMDYEYDVRTPEMPDMSSITQDIFKLVSQCNTEMKSAAAGQPPLLKTAQQTKASGKENRLVTHSQNLALVTEMEFGTLTAYLKQVPLHRLNDAIHEINNALLQRHHGSHSGSREFLTSELRCIMGSGANPSLVMMCLIELKRVQHVHGAGNDALYRLLPTHA